MQNPIKHCYVIGIACFLFLSVLACTDTTTSKKTSPIEPQATVSPTTTIVGNWTNSYGSLMEIANQEPDGFFVGIYSSTTGSSGDFFLLGNTATSLTENSPITIGIYWRDIEGRPFNQTYHWVSMMTGQIFPDSSKMELLHDMVASTDFPAVDVFEPGHYTETLVFTPYTGPTGTTLATDNLLEKPPFDTKIVANAVPLTGNWTNQNPNSPFQSFNITSQNNFLILQGNLIIEGQSQLFYGLTDFSATGDTLQSVVINTTFADQSVSPVVTAGLSLGGFYNPATNQLEFMAFQSKATTYENKYAGANMLGTEVFIAQ